MIRGCGRDVAPPPRLRFSPLEIFTQRQLQPILARIYFRGRSALSLALIPVILHRGPVRMRRGENTISSRAGIFRQYRQNSMTLGEMIEFEVVIRPIKALGEEMGNRIGPQLSRLKEAAVAPR